MKIVLANHHFPPRYSAGAEMYVLKVARWLLGQGHQVEVVCVESIDHACAGGVEHQHETYQGVSVWRLHLDLVGVKDGFRRNFDNPAIGEWFRRFLIEQHPDLVHINSGYLLSGSPIVATKALGLPLVVSLHDFWFLCPLITLLRPTGELCTVPDDAVDCAWCLATQLRRYREPELRLHGAAGRIVKPLLRSALGSQLPGIEADAAAIVDRRRYLFGALAQADTLVAPSEFLRGMFIRQGIAASKIALSRFGLDISHWPNAERAETDSNSALRIGYLGQLAPHKGVHLLVQAFQGLDLSKRRARLTLYGDPTRQPAYVGLLQRLARGNPAIEFAGPYDNRLAGEILGRTDITVVPSTWYENSPIAIIEALTAGVPVVTADIGGMPELVKHDVNGLLFRAGSVHDLAIQLQRIVDEPGLLANLASNVRPVRFIDDEMAQLMDLYRQVVGAAVATTVSQPLFDGALT